MDDHGPDRIAATLGGTRADFPTGPDDLAGLPERWLPTTDPDPQLRRTTALSLWDPETVALFPKFAAALHAGLVDVRPARVLDDYALLYLLRTRDGDDACWIGWDPAGAGEDRPVFWSCLPAPIQRFLLDTHAGFVAATDCESHGVMRPRDMATYARWAGAGDEPLPGWDGSDGRISSTELMIVTTDGGLMDYCVSPRLATGSVAVLYEGDIEVRADLAAVLDQQMIERLDLW